MRYRFIVFVMTMLMAGHVGAADFDAELKRLQSTLTTLNQELTATYSQFQMVLEARRASIQQEMLEGPRPGLDYRNYDAIVAAQAEARERGQELTRQMDQLLVKVRAIEAEKQPILQQVYELLRRSQTATTEGPAAEPPNADTSKDKAQRKPY